MSVPTVADPVVSSSGSASISDDHKALVDAIVHQGLTPAKAALSLGYGKGKNTESARVSASRILRRAEVQSYMRSEIEGRLLPMASKALVQLEKLSEAAKSEYVRLEASKDVLDRAGFVKVDRVAHLHQGSFKVEIDLG